MFWCVISAALVALVAVAGCSVPKARDFKPSKLFSLGDEDEPEEGIPVRMAGTWTDTVLSQPGQNPQRGFGGRLMFYERNQEKPILVDGQLVVYAFDETGREITDNRPTRRYVFPPDQMPLHMSKSELGASYSFWLPWDEAGGPQTEVSLICRFEPKGGAVVTSEQTRHRLPGSIARAAAIAGTRPPVPKLPEGVPSRPAQTTLESVQQSRRRDRNTQLASYESVMPSEPNSAPIAGTSTSSPIEAERRMTTTSIALPQSFRLPVSAASAEPMPPRAAGIPQLMPSPPQALPIESQQQPAVNQASPAPPLSTPALNTIPGSHPAVLNSRFGGLPNRPLMTPTIATPTLYSPSSGGFGFGFAVATQQQAADQPAALPPALAANMRTSTWNTAPTAPLGTAAPGASRMAPINNVGLGSADLQQPIVQPASQPLPPPTGLTTTVSYPTPATALR